MCSFSGVMCHAVSQCADGVAGSSQNFSLGNTWKAKRNGIHFNQINELKYGGDYAA